MPEKGVVLLPAVTFKPGTGSREQSRLAKRRISTFTKFQGLARLENCTFATFFSRFRKQAEEQERKTTTFKWLRPFCPFVPIAIGQPMGLDVTGDAGYITDSQLFCQVFQVFSIAIGQPTVVVGDAGHISISPTFLPHRQLIHHIWIVGMLMSQSI